MTLPFRILFASDERVAAGIDTVADFSSMFSAADSGQWQLGDLKVNRLGFGAMRLPQTGGAFDTSAPPRDRQSAIAVLRRAVELGVNHIDTAAFYFSALRSANELINSALRPYPNDLVIVTKVGPLRAPSGKESATARPEQLRGLVEENIRQLGLDHLDVVNLRCMGQASIAEHFGALAELREKGLIRHLGLSAVTPQHLAEARAIAPVVCVQNSYAVGYRRSQDVMIDLCGELGVAYVPFFAIAAAAREAGAVNAEHDTVREVAGKHGATPAQVRLAWTLHRGPHVLAIPGTGSVAHLEENVGAGALRLDAEDLARLGALS